MCSLAKYQVRSDNDERTQHVTSKLTVDSALSYLKKAERVLSKDEFAAFLEIIEDFKHQRIPTKTVVCKVKAIFKGKPQSLITDFNMFLPPEHLIKTEVETNKNENFVLALKLVKKIRQRFEKSQPKALSTFIEILGKFQNDTITFFEARTRVKELFKGQSDILQEFNAFLPMRSQRIDLSGECLERHSSDLHEVNAENIAMQEGTSSTTSISYTTQSHNAARGNGRAALKSGLQSVASVELRRADAATVKRKIGDRETDCSVTVYGKVADASIGNTKRRLISVTRLHNSFKKCFDGQNKDCHIENRPRPSRKSQRPNRLHLNTETIKLFSCRAVRLFKQSELASVLPLPLVQKVQISLRALHSSGANAPRA